MKARVYRRIAVFGHFGRGNLGDEATLATVLRNVRERQPTAEVYALTANPADTEQRHHTRALPIRRTNPQKAAAAVAPANPAKPAAVRIGAVQCVKRILKSIPILGALLRLAIGLPAALAGLLAELRFLLQCRRQLRGTDLFIIAGGGQLGDYFEGVWGYPYTIFKWTLLARLRGADVVFLSVGAGPLVSRLSRSLFRNSLRIARYKSFRDQHSRRLVEKLSISRSDNRVAPDMVHGLRVDSGLRPADQPIQVVGINPLPFHDRRYWAEDDDNVYQD